MKIPDRRKFIRLGREFPVKLFTEELDCSFEGKTVNLSQAGAFIKTTGYHFLQVKDETILTCFIPPDFTGQDTTIGLRGSAIICRTDQESEAVAVQFVKIFKQFERIPYFEEFELFRRWQY